MNKSPQQRLNLSGSWHKATLALTIPRCIFKSSAKDLSLLIFELDSASTGRACCDRPEPLPCYDLGCTPKGSLCVCIVTLGKLRIAPYQHRFGLRGVQP